MDFSQYLLLLLALAGPFGAYSETRMAPSPLRRLCEQALISSGLYHPKTRATIMSSGYRVEALTGYYLAVQLPRQEKPRVYNYTNRDGFELRYQMIYPAAFVAPDLLRGLKVVDLACGEGRLVEELRRGGVEVLGLDVHLSEYQKSKPYFVQASMDHTPFADQSIDVLMSSMGPIRYDLHDRQLMLRTLHEAHRVLKTGGVFRFSPLELDDLYPADPPATTKEAHDAHYARLQVWFMRNGARPERDLASTGLWPLPAGWKIKNFPSKDWFSTSPPDGQTRGPYYWMELERID